MDLKKYHATQVAVTLHRSEPRKWTDLLGLVDEIEKLFEPYTQNDMLVLVPRFNGGYISFRYCGLEVLQLYPTGKLVRCIGLEDGKIRRRAHPICRDCIGDLCGVLDEVVRFVEGYLRDFSGVAAMKKQEKMIPGFSLEHWLENVILADNSLGVECRGRLGLNQNLGMVVSQVPIILGPKAVGSRNRHRHIDLFSVNDDGRIVVVELKKDNDFCKAKSELNDYTKWLLGMFAGVHACRGYVATMVDEHYVPARPGGYSGIRAEDVDAVAVVVDPPEAPPFLESSVKLRVFKLATDWPGRGSGMFVA